MDKRIKYKILKDNAQMAIDFYNLKYAKPKEIEKFKNKYLSNDDKDFIYRQLNYELDTYCWLMDFVIAGKQLDRAMLDKISQSLSVYYIQELIDDRYVIKDDDKNKVMVFIKAFYNILVLRSQRIVYVRRCGLDGCQKLFIPNRSGSEQIYCNTNHSKKAWALKKKLDATKDS